LTVNFARNPAIRLEILMPPRSSWSLMTDLFPRCRTLPFFRGFDDAELKLLVERGRWFTLGGGAELFKQGELSDALYFALSGRLIIVRDNEAGEEEVIGYVRSGEPVGEMSFLSLEPHSASAFALRESEILAIDRADVEFLFERSSDFTRAVAGSVVERARHPALSFKRASPRVFAIIGSSPSIDIAAHAARLTNYIRLHGRRAIYVRDVEALGEGAFEALEEDNDVIILTARVGDTFEYRFALRNADRFFVFARQDARPPRPFPMAPTVDAPSRRFRLVDIVMLHEGAKSGSAADWVEAVDAHRIFHVSGPRTEERLARAIAGRTVALVLSGGGARAYAHIGAVKALRERKVMIDFLAGASMGAIVAACVAMGWDDEEIEARIRDGFVDSNPLGDFVMPVVALTKGARVEERLKRHFGDVMIEDLEIPFFCTSSELTKGVTRVHRRGLLREALRATISLPGILPPVIENGALLVDGAVMNNFPTDHMTNMHRGVTIGVDVAREASIEPDLFADPPAFAEWVWRNGLRSAPPVVTLLMRAATSRQELRPKEAPPDILIAPPVTGVELRDWKEYDRAVIDGYAATLGALDREWSKLAAIVDAGRHS